MATCYIEDTWLQRNARPAGDALELLASTYEFLDSSFSVFMSTQLMSTKASTSFIH